MRSHHHGWFFSRMLQASRKHATLVRNLRQLPLAGIAPKRAHGPERRAGGGVDPGGLGGFLRFGLDIGVDLRGRGRQLSACHGSLAASSRAVPPAQTVLLPSSLVSDRAHTLGENRIPSLSLVLHGGGGGGRASPSLLLQHHHGFLLRHTESGASACCLLSS